MWDSAHRAKQNIGRKSAEHDRKGKHCNRKAVAFMHPLRRICPRASWLLGRPEIIALANGFVPVGAFDFVARPFDHLIQRDHEKQEKRNVGHAAHHGDIASAQP